MANQECLRVDSRLERGKLGQAKENWLADVNQNPLVNGTRLSVSAGSHVIIEEKVFQPEDVPNLICRKLVAPPMLLILDI